MKTCTKCKRELPETEFYQNSGRREGKLDSWCKECEKAAAREWQKKNPKRVFDNQRKRLLKKKFGMSVEDYEKMLREQGGVCRICGRPETVKIYGSVLPLAVDHDHNTGKVRGLLCVACNHGIGKFQDDAARLRAAADYLDEANGHG
jgi:hypothetical protein